MLHMRQAAELGSVAITALGMVSALGQDSATACAASRAGICRSGKLDYFRVRSRDADEVEKVIGHTAPMITRGFEDNARLLRLLAAALADLRGSLLGHPAIASAFYLSAPAPLRSFTGIELIQHEELRQSRRQKAAEPQLESMPQAAGQALLTKAAELVGWPCHPNLQFVSGSGHTGVAEAVAQALSDLCSGVVSSAVVGGVDSLLDEQTLGWLQATGRLKTGAAPAGVQPGEACALLYLEPQPVGLHRTLALISGVWISWETGTFLSGHPAVGAGLSQALTQAALYAGSRTTDRTWVITDQNGEDYRASEWGATVCRIAARCPAFLDTTLWYPAVSFGDTAAASGAVSICLAARSLDRGYAPAPAAFVSSSSDGPLRAAMLISAAPNK
jgi:3-oxoacyl-[acyl-carrier-protein] synthase-1